MEDVKADERRRFARYTVEQVPVRFRSEMLDFEADAAFLEGEAADIGLGGLFVRSEFLEMPGTLVQVLLTLPQTERQVKIRGRVAWIADAPPRGPGMGIAVDGSPLQQAVIDHCRGYAQA